MYVTTVAEQYGLEIYWQFLIDNVLVLQCSIFMFVNIADRLSSQNMFFSPVFLKKVISNVILFYLQE